MDWAVAADVVERHLDDLSNTVLVHMVHGESFDVCGECYIVSGEGLLQR